MARITLVISLLSTIGYISSAFSDEADIKNIKASLGKMFQSQKLEVGATEIDGIYEVVYGSEILYATKDGRYILQGDMIDLVKKENITETKRSSGRIGLMKSIDPDSMIIFSPDETKHIVTVFTDIDCGYCRKLHSEMQTYMDEGIKIRYLAYPRSGVNTASYYKAVAVWCSENRQEAITQAKSGIKVNSKACESPVLEHMAVADKVGVTGTPTLVFADGSVVPGYMPAKQLRKVLDERLN